MGGGGEGRGPHVGCRLKFSTFVGKSRLMIKNKLIINIRYLIHSLLQG